MAHMPSLRRAFRTFANSVAAVAVFAASAFNAVAPATAANPAFNNAPGDQPTLQVGSQHDAQTANWKRSINAQIGEVVSFLVWDNQTVAGTTANNVKVKVNLPTQVAASSTASALLGADNADTVTGMSTVNVGAASKLTYIPGSATFFKMDGGSLKAQPSFPNGISEEAADAIVTTGLNLGNQGAGVNNIQAIMIQARVEGTNVSIMTNQEVALNSATVYGTTAPAGPESIMSFKVFMQNNGNATGTNTKITTTLDPRLTYVPKSSYALIKRDNKDYEVELSDAKIKFEGNKITWSFVDIAPIAEESFYLLFDAKVADASKFSAGTTNIQNCATASFAQVSKNTNCVTVAVTKAATNAPVFNVLKQVRNLTLGESEWYDARLASAKPGDILAFRLGITNIGNTAAANVLVKDVLPSGLSYEGDLRLTSASNPNGTAISGDALVKGGYTLASLANGNANGVTLTFKAKVVASCANQDIVNRAEIWYNGQKKAESAAGFINSCDRGLIIRKDILDPKDNTFKDDAGTITGDREITFRITVQNNGSTTLVHPTLRDVMPQNATYVAGSFTIDGEVQAQTGVDAFFDQGIILTDLNPGVGKEIMVKFKVAGCPAYITADILNTAFVKANGVTEISDKAHAVVENDCSTTTPTPTPPTHTPTPSPSNPGKPGKPTLPKTGPEAGAVALGLISAGSAARYYLGKRKYAKALTKIDVL